MALVLLPRGKHWELLLDLFELVLRAVRRARR